MPGRNVSATAARERPGGGRIPAWAFFCGRRGQPAGSMCRDGAKAALRPRKTGGAFVSPACRVGRAVIGFTLFQTRPRQGREQSLHPFTGSDARPETSFLRARAGIIQSCSRPGSNGLSPIRENRRREKILVRLPVVVSTCLPTGRNLPSGTIPPVFRRSFVATKRRRLACSVRVGTYFVGLDPSICKRWRGSLRIFMLPPVLAPRPGGDVAGPESVRGKQWVNRLVPFLGRL